VYFFSIFKILGRIRDILEKIQWNFLWSSTEEKIRMSLVRWEKVCYLKEFAGLNLRRIGHLNRALLTKIGWI
jgi:hypothetical protein